MLRLGMICMSISSQMYLSPVKWLPAKASNPLKVSFEYLSNLFSSCRVP